MSYILQICVQQGKSRCIIQIISSTADKSTNVTHLRGSGCFRRCDEGNIITKYADGLFWSLVGERWTTHGDAIVVYCMVKNYHDHPIGVVKCHTANATSCVLQNFCWLSLSLSRYCQSEYSSSSCKVKCSVGTFAKLNSCYWFLRLEDGSLFGASVVNQVASYDSDRAICETYRKLRQILKGCESRYLWVSATARL